MNKLTIRQEEFNSVIHTGITYENNYVLIQDSQANIPQQPHSPYSDTFLYLPKNLDLKGLMKENGKKERFFFHYAYIISTVYLAKFLNKKYTKDSYVPVNIDIARTIISQRKCVEIIKDLIKWGILECDNKKQIGSKSFGYRFPQQPHSPYSDTFYKLRIEDKLITKKMNNFKEKQRAEATAAGEDYLHLFNYIHQIKIDYKAAMTYINENYVPFTDDYESRRLSVELIDGGDIFFKVDKKGNRAHTNLTNMASDLRRFIRYNGKKLGQVDLRNSQPFLLNMVIKNKINMQNLEQFEEYTLYKNLTESGEFYEYLMSEFGIYSEDDKARKEFKLLFFGRVFFDVNRKELKKEEKLFQELFPTIFSIIRKIKEEDYTNLALSLQKAESKVIINECIRKIRMDRPDIFVSTIHDSIVGELENLDYFKDVIEEVFIKYNLAPTVKKEKF